MKLRQRNFISALVILTTIVPSTFLSPISEQLTPDRQLQQLASASKLETLQDQLQKFQVELEILKTSNLNPIKAHLEKQPDSATQASVQSAELQRQRPQLQLGTWGNFVRPKVPLEGTFYDRPVDVSKRLYERRQIGLQPFRRRGLAEPQIQLQLLDTSDLRQEVLNVVEDHLLRDLEAAKVYGIAPEEILQDLRQKQSDNVSNQT